VNRRNFITLLGGAAAGPLAAQAQQRALRRLGALIGGDPGDTLLQAWLAEFLGALRKLGWVDGRNLQLDVRWASGEGSRAKAYAAELVALKPDVLFVDNTFTAHDLQQETHMLPIVFTHIMDPVGSGFVASLARPGGNMTGFANAEYSSLGKIPELTKQIVPDVNRIAIMSYKLTELNSNLNTYTGPVADALASLGLQGPIYNVESAREMEKAIAEFGQQPNGVLMVPGDPLTTTYRKVILAAAARYKLPVVGGFPGLAADGALLNYSANTADQYRNAAGYVDRILKGAKPADLPVQQPTRYELVINLKTAKALGLTVPQPLLITADKVIE
jgi:putative ABC transport system substrate-binding protein